MRVTFVLNHRNLSGGVRAIALYADGLRRKGHDVVVVSRRKPKPTLIRQIKSLLRGSGWIADPNKFDSHLDELEVEQRFVPHNRPVTDADVPDADVVVATWWETAYWVNELSPRKGAKVYFIQHDETVFEGQPVPRVAGSWRLPMQKIVSAKWLQDLARDRYDDSDAIYVPYGIDLKLFNAPPRSKQPIPTVGMMYSPARFKGCDISLNAFELARKNIPELRLLAFGSRPVSADLPLPAGASYFERPPQQEIVRIYSSCDAYLFASRCEGFGLPVIEAMGCRTPVIATPTGAGAEVVPRGGGIAIPHEDPQAMAEAVIRLCRMSNVDWQGLSESAWELSREYDVQRSVHLFEEALLAIANRAHG